MSDGEAKRIPAIFYRTAAGGEPVREWLKALPKEDRRLIGYDIETVEFGWPVGMPVCRPLGDGIFEVRTGVTQNRIARVLLHGFIKKSQRTPKTNLALARANKNKHEKGLP